MSGRHRKIRPLQAQIGCYNTATPECKYDEQARLEQRTWYSGTARLIHLQLGFDNITQTGWLV